MTQPDSQVLLSPIFVAIRFVVVLALLIGVVLTIRWAILAFVGKQGRDLDRKRKYLLIGCNAALLAILFLLRSFVVGLFTALGSRISRVLPGVPEGWPSNALTGIFYTCISLLTLVLLIQIVGLLFWFFERRLDAHIAGKLATILKSRSLSEYILKTLFNLNRYGRIFALVLLIGAFLLETFRFFRSTQPIVRDLMEILGKPARSITEAVLNYLPEMGYLCVILFFGWILLKAVRLVFISVRDGSLSIPGFQREWASQTYQLVRIVIWLFILMVSFPYLPGASSQFFQGFSVFVGALVTFGSTGAIGNIMSGITLTYTNAFRIGDFIRIGEIVGFIRERSLLVTRIVTLQNESVTVPNGAILSTSIINYTQLAASKGLVLTINAGIGYDVDWRTVQRLLIQGASRTEHILSDPPPCVWQTALGNYAIEYQLRAFSDRADLMYDTHSRLRANVLDEFNREGVEIMTPSIFAHRDASNLAVPEERFPERPVPPGIAINLKGMKPGS